MVDEEFNPYETPRSKEPGGAPDGMWQVSGSTLLFRDGARLPEVDLFTGRNDVPLTPASSEFAAAKGLAAVWLQWGGVVTMALAVFGSGMWDYSLVLAILIVVVVTRVLGIFLKSRMIRARLHWRVATDSESRNRKFKRAQWILILLGFGFFGMGILSESMDWMSWGVVAMTVFLIMGAVLGLFSRQLRCSGEKDGWFVLKGIPSAGLWALAVGQAESNRRLVEDKPKLRLRKVYAFHGYRAPLRDLLGMSWSNPLLVLIITVMKLTRSKNLIRDFFHWSESEELGEQEWDPDLKKVQSEWLALEVSNGWRPLGAHWIGSPMGDVLTQSFTMISPDGSQAMSGAVVRLATAHMSRTIQEVSFRSWRSDGTLRLTSNSRIQRPLPEGFDVKVRKGDVRTVHKSHQLAAANDEIVALGFPDEWEARLKEEAEARRQTLEVAGINGPVREVELPG